MPDTLQGGCLCGAHRYELGGAPLAISHCHCSVCRRASGGTLVTWITQPSAGFQWLGDAPAVFESSPGTLRTFCGTCGTTLTFAHVDHGEEVDVSATTVDDPAALAPDDEIWWTSRLPWAPSDPALPKLNEAHWQAGYPRRPGNHQGDEA